MVKCIFTNRIEFPTFFGRVELTRWKFRMTSSVCTVQTPYPFVYFVRFCVCTLIRNPKAHISTVCATATNTKYQFLSIRPVVNFECLPFDLHSFCKMKSWKSNDVDTSCHETEHRRIASLFGITIFVFIFNDADRSFSLLI